MNVTFGTSMWNCVDTVVKTNQKSVNDFKAGNKAAFKYLVGQVMRVSKGTLNPKDIEDHLKAYLCG